MFSYWLFLVSYISVLSVNALSNPLAYITRPNGLYTPPKLANITTLLDLINSREDLRILGGLLTEVAGFSEAFDTQPEWIFTFFAPSNAAFNNTGQYYETLVATAKGKWWIGNFIQHAYIPNTKLNSSTFTEEYQRFQTSTFLYAGVQRVGDQVVINKVATVLESDIPVTNGLVHIVDHILDPSAQILELDLPKVNQAFIAGSCANPALPFC